MHRSKGTAKKTPKTRFSLVIPVRNGGDLLVSGIESVMIQSILPSEVIIFDTESKDDALGQLKPLLGKIPFRLIPVRLHDFDHGGTRNKALQAARFPWVLFMTQDAVCANRFAFANLLAAALGKGVVAAYGKQLPHHDATPLAATAREFNYGNSLIRQDMEQAPLLGIKTWFSSNSFCVWNKAGLQRAGGFAEKLILGEDMHAAARLIQAGGAVVYEPRAQVRHSHNYSARDEFKRYFDIGVFHQLHRELLFKAGDANKEGLKFVLGQALALFRMNSYWSLLKLPFHIAAKFIGYKLGRSYTLLGKGFSRRLSMHKSYWS